MRDLKIITNSNYFGVSFQVESTLSPVSLDFEHDVIFDGVALNSEKILDDVGRKLIHDLLRAHNLIQIDYDPQGNAYCVNVDGVTLDTNFINQELAVLSIASGVLRREINGSEDVSTFYIETNPNFISDEDLQSLGEDFEDDGNSAEEFLQSDECIYHSSDMLSVFNSINKEDYGNNILITYMRNLLLSDSLKIDLTKEELLFVDKENPYFHSPILSRMIEGGDIASCKKLLQDKTIDLHAKFEGGTSVFQAALNSDSSELHDLILKHPSTLDAKETDIRLLKNEDKASSVRALLAKESCSNILIDIKKTLSI